MPTIGDHDKVSKDNLGDNVKVSLLSELTPWAPRAFIGIAAAYRECGVPVGSPSIRS